MAGQAVNVNYVVNVQAGATSQQTLMALNAQATQLQNTLSNLSAGGAGGAGGGGYNPNGGRPAGGASYGEQLQRLALGRRIVPGLTAAMAIHIGRGAVEAGTAGLRETNDPGSTEYSVNRRLKETMPIIGGFTKDWLEFLDEVYEVAPRIREMKRRTAEAALRIEMASENRQRESGEQLRQQSYWAHREVMFGSPAMDREAGGQAAYFTRGLRPEQAEHMRAGLTAQDVANRRAVIAGVESDQAGDQFRSALTRQSEATRNREIVERDLQATRARLKDTGGKYSAQDEEALRLKEKALVVEIARERAAIAEAEKAGHVAEQKTNALYERRVELSKTMSSLAEQRLKFAEDEAAHLKEGTIAFGGMSREERLQAVEAARQVKRFGLDTISDQERGLVQRAGLFDKLIENKAMEAARKDPAYFEALGIGGMRKPGDVEADIEEFRKQALKFGELGPTMRDAFDSLKKAIDQIVKDNRQWQQAHDANRLSEQQNQQMQRGAGTGK
jgi:hypothetical protein